MRRREFLRIGLGGAAAALATPVWLRDPAGAQAAGPFRHGVASGDPLPDRVILWTRVTPSDDAVPGSGAGVPTEVAWEVAADEGFTTVVASGAVTAEAASDHTVKVDVAGLAPATTYWYRFSALDATSPVGRTRTAPAAGADVESLRFGVVSCSNWEGGYFSAYRHLAARDDLDVVVHLGDYVYEYEVGGYGPGPAFGRVHDPVTEMTVLEHYRRRHAQYKTDPDLAQLHQRYAMIATIDDHEVTDNTWSGGAVNHTPGAEGDIHARRAHAYQAYFEWMPIRATGGDAEPTRIYRRLRYGTLVELFMLDERTYRSQQPSGVSGDVLVTSPVPDEPGRTMLGPEQLDFLESGLRSTDATWKVLGNGVVFFPFLLADLPDIDGVTPLLLTLLAALGVAPPLVLNGDQWDGYRTEQLRLTEVFGEVGGVVVLTGDVHASFASELPPDPGSYLPGVGGPSNGVEFVTPAVSSDSFVVSLDAAVPGGAQLAGLLPAVLDVGDPWIKYFDGERHGFGVLEVTAAHAHFDWYYTSDRTDPVATASFGTAFETPAGSNRVVPAAALGPRPAVAAPAAAAAPVPPPAGGTLPPSGAPTAAVAAAAAGVAAVAVTARRVARRHAPE